MAGNSLRIDSDTTRNTDGSVKISYTEGDAPLPLSVSGEAAEWATAADFVEQAEAFVAGLTAAQKIFIAASPTVKADPQMKKTSVESLRNKTITVDLVGATMGISIV